MIQLPNAFLTLNLSAPIPRADRTAAEYSPVRPPGDVAAGSHSVTPSVLGMASIESSSSTGGNSEAPAAAASNPKAAGLHVKFAALRREKAEPHRFILDEAWFMAELDEKPLFLR